MKAISPQAVRDALAAYDDRQDPLLDMVDWYGIKVPLWIAVGAETGVITVPKYKRGRNATPHRA